MIELEAGDAWMTVHPDEGGRIGKLEVGEQPLLHFDPGSGPLGWGCYPMAPWAGRVRHGRFTFDGSRYQMPLNLPPHAIHGTGFVSRWEVLDAGRDYCDLQCDLSWPFGGIATQHLQLDEHGLTCILSVFANARPMPAVVGWHPCFMKPRRAQLQFGRMYVRDHESVAVAELVQPKPHPWDDCFLEPQAPLRLHYPHLTVTVDSDCDHWVIYDEQDGLTCVEPQSGPPDAFTIGGAARLEPGDMLQRQMAVRWAANREESSGK
ncbi:MAG: aldose epimerase [Actinomycetota bacterium]|nr:aldose epimerase [Actinomycetota bacterium]